MGTLIQDIEKQSDWIIKAFSADKLKLDYTIDSFIEIDKFFNKHATNGQAKQSGRLSIALGPILFSIAAYIGETIIKNVPGTIWITDDKDPEAELNVTLKLPNGGVIFPTQRVMKRFKNGNEDSIYVYGHEITKEFTNVEFNKKYWKVLNEKPWWFFWK